MNLLFQRHATVPRYTRDFTSPDQFKWSAEFEVPAIGDDVVIRLNGIGRAKVVGYATVDGYLGVMTVPYHPPVWWVSQNGPPDPDKPALAFGREVSPVSPSAPVIDAARNRVVGGGSAIVNGRRTGLAGCSDATRCERYTHCLRADAQLAYQSRFLEAGRCATFISNGGESRRD